MSRAQPDRRQTPVTEAELDEKFGPAETPTPTNKPTWRPDGVGGRIIEDEAEGIIERAKQAMDRPGGVTVLPPAPETLASALARFQAKLPRIVKDETARVTGKDREGNPVRYTYGYADLATVSEAVLPLLGSVGLAFTALPTMTPEGFGLRYSLRHGASGEILDGFWPIKLGAPQETGSAITYARRYSLMAAVGVFPADEDDDGAAASQRESFEDARPAQAPQAQRDPKTEAVFDHAARLKTARLIDLPKLWDEAIQLAPQNAPGPVVYDAFGRRLAEIIDSTESLERYEKLTRVLNGIGKDALPWSHEGVTPVQRYEALGVRLRQQSTEPPDPAEEIEARIAGAKTIVDLAKAGDALAEAIQAGLIERPKATELRVFEAERRVALQRTGDAVAPPQPDPWQAMGPHPGSGSSDDNATALDEPPWVTEEGPAEEWPPVPSAEPSAAYLALREEVREHADEKGWPADVIGRFDGAFERGEVSGDEHAALHDLMRTRPLQAGNLLNFWQWQAETAVSHAELDRVTLQVNGERQLDKPQVDEKGARFVYAAVAERRKELGPQTGGTGG